jgi:hypothetical protein
MPLVPRLVIIGSFGEIVLVGYLLQLGMPKSLAFGWLRHQSLKRRFRL